MRRLCLLSSHLCRMQCRDWSPFSLFSPKTSMVRDERGCRRLKVVFDAVVAAVGGVDVAVDVAAVEGAKEDVGDEAEGAGES